jgi:hypothetical protein
LRWRRSSPPAEPKAAAAIKGKPPRPRDAAHRTGTILELDAWAGAREKAPELFEQELAVAFRTISAAPGVGRIYPDLEPKFDGSSCAQTRNHVYYVERDRDVLVLAVRGAVKGAGPDLRALSAVSTGLAPTCGCQSTARRDLAAVER